MKFFTKRIWEFIKKKYWYIVLLIISSIYVWCYRFDIYELKELNTTNLIFILWLILLLCPLFSEMEFLGVKIKKEVQKETEEVKGLLQNLQMQVNQLQMTNTVANNIQLNNSVLPSEQKLEELLQEVKKMQTPYSGSDAEEKNSISKEEESNVYLFRVRLSIESSLREICEKFEYTDRFPVTGMINYLYHREVFDRTTRELLLEVIKIANRGVHGEIVSAEYLDFVRKIYPRIMRQLQDASSRL